MADRSPIRRQAIERISMLYEIDERCRGQLPPERQAMRLGRAGPILTELHAWLIEQVRRPSKKSELASAIRYALFSARVV